MAKGIHLRRIHLPDRRTRIGLEQEMWDALEEICFEQGITVDLFVAGVDAERNETSLTPAVRVAVLMHYRTKSDSNGNTEGRSNAQDLVGRGQKELNPVDSARTKHISYEDWIMSDDFAVAATRHFTEAKRNALSDEVE